LRIQPVNRAFPLTLTFVDAVASVDTRDIYFTSAISPGSQGGPLLNNAGEVIGLMYARREDVAIATRGDVALEYVRKWKIPV